MWRTLASLLLTLTAFGWAIVASAVCFLYTSAFWRDTLGRFGAFWGALAALAVSVYTARLLLLVADKLLEPHSGPFDGSVYAASPRDTFYLNWRHYADEIVRNRRVAFYMRTRQWERLAALQKSVEPDLLNSGAQPPVAAERAMLIPHRLSMADSLGADEVARGARRGKLPQPRLAAAERWRFLDAED